MEYGRLKPIDGVPSAETTAFTMKSIKELLAEEEAARAAKAAEPQAVQAAPHVSTPLPPLQRPPHHWQPLAPAEPSGPVPRGEEVRKPVSLLARLFGK